MEAGSYRSLEIYQLAHRLGIEVHRFSMRMPKFELYESGSQLRRAAKSISANIVEGYGRRRYKSDFIKFLIYAQASCDETTEWLEYVRDCHETLASATTPLLQTTNELGRKINKFTQAVIASHQPTRCPHKPLSSIQ